MFTGRAPDLSLWYSVIVGSPKSCLKSALRFRNARRTACNSCRTYASSAARQLDRNSPIRILFCGADDLSITSLRALDREAQDHPESVKSIDVVCRPGKPSGRGLKQIKHPPIKGVADELRLPVHQIDTFTGWNLPRYESSTKSWTDLIIAISFGLRVPPRILDGSTHGGINLHPSLLPSFSGPSPLHWIVMTGQTHHGVTLQTLHPTKFDAGVIIDQTPAPGLVIDDHTQRSDGSNGLQRLQLLSGKMAAEMLLKSIRTRSFAQSDNGLNHISMNTYAASYAPKIDRKLSCVDFQEMGYVQIMRMLEGVTPLWVEVRKIDGTSISPVMVSMQPAKPTEKAEEMDPGLPYAVPDQGTANSGSKPHLYVKTKDSGLFRIDELKIPGGTWQPAFQVAKSAGLLQTHPSSHNGSLSARFHSPLSIPEDVRVCQRATWKRTGYIT